MTRVFFDMEFTGLQQRTTPISLAMVSANGDTFYAEFTDFDRYQVDQWIQTNVMDHLILGNQVGKIVSGNATTVRGTTSLVSINARLWMDDVYSQKYGHGNKLQHLEMWGDCLAYDWVLLCELFGGAQHMPGCVWYIPFDICTMFRLCGINPDINREEFANTRVNGSKHNALHDAMVLKVCYHKLLNMMPGKVLAVNGDAL